jgi:hypothetical protein
METCSGEILHPSLASMVRREIERYIYERKRRGNEKGAVGM